MRGLAHAEGAVVRLLVRQTRNSLLHTLRLLDEQVVVAQTHLAVARGVGVRVGDGLEHAQQRGRRLHVLGEAESGERLRVKR